MTVRARMQVGTSAAPAHPAASASVAPKVARDASVWATQAPLCISARENSPAARGEATRAQVSIAPADSPNNITRAGSPPKAAMLFCTHWSAAI